MAHTNNTDIVNGFEFDNSKWKYTKVNVNKVGGKSVGISNSNTNKVLMVTTPLMMTWGVNANDYDNSGVPKYDMSIQFPRENDSNHTEHTTSFLNGLEAMETKIKEDAVANAKDWFNKSKMSPEVVEALWSPMLKYSKNPNSGEPDKSKAPRLVVKLPYYSDKDKYDFEFYNTQKDDTGNLKKIFPLEENCPNIIDLVQSKMNVSLVIKCGGLWFANGKFGVTWRLEQGVVQPKASIRGVCQINLTDDVVKSMVQSTKELVSSEGDDTMVEDSDNEDDVSEVASVEAEVEAEVEAAAEAAAEVAAEVVEEAVVKEQPVKKRKKVVKKTVASNV